MEDVSGGCTAWDEIESGLGDETHRWLGVLRRRATSAMSSSAALIASVAHLAYHLGAIRQIAKDSRGPREGTF